MSNEDCPVCPICGTPLRQHDSRKRIWKLPDGKVRYLHIRRMYCDNCKILHNELPDCLVPYKHYGTSIIEKVIDGRVNPDSPGYAEYPCEKTMQDWKDWIERNRANIDGQIKSFGYRFLDYTEQLLKSKVSLLDKLRELKRRWLRIIVVCIYNSCGSLAP